MEPILELGTDELVDLWSEDAGVVLAAEACCASTFGCGGSVGSFSSCVGTLGSFGTFACGGAC